jgi:uncharacterized Zn-finger protein
MSTTATYMCDKCDKVFATKSSLNAHTNSSKTCGVNLFDCSYCDKKFTSNNILKNHLNICVEKRIGDIQNNYEMKLKEQGGFYLSKIKNTEDESTRKLQDKDNIINETIKTYQNKIKDQDVYYDSLIRDEHLSKERCKSEAKAKESLYIKQIEKLEKTVEDCRRLT